MPNPAEECRESTLQQGGGIPVALAYGKDCLGRRPFAQLSELGLTCFAMRVSTGSNGGRRSCWEIRVWSPRIAITRGVATRRDGQVIFSFFVILLFWRSGPPLHDFAARTGAREHQLPSIANKGPRDTSGHGHRSVSKAASWPCDEWPGIRGQHLSRSGERNHRQIGENRTVIVPKRVSRVGRRTASPPREPAETRQSQRQTASYAASYPRGATTALPGLTVRGSFRRRHHGDACDGKAKIEAGYVGGGLVAATTRPRVGLFTRRPAGVIPRRGIYTGRGYFSLSATTDGRTSGVLG